MKKVTSVLMIAILALFISCTKNDNAKTTTENVGVESHTIIAQGWGETEEKALADAKEDALRQFGFKVVEKGGEPELIPAGKILDHKVLSSSFEEIEKDQVWWDVEIEAELASL